MIFLLVNIGKFFQVLAIIISLFCVVGVCFNFSTKNLSSWLRELRLLILFLFFISCFLLEFLMTQPHVGRQLMLFVVVDLKKYNFYF